MQLNKRKNKRKSHRTNRINNREYDLLIDQLNGDKLKYLEQNRDDFDRLFFTWAIIEDKLGNEFHV